MAPSDIEKDDVLAAIAEYDKLGQDEFLKQYEFGKASKFRLVHSGQFYDSRQSPESRTNLRRTTSGPLNGPSAALATFGAVTILESLRVLYRRGRVALQTDTAQRGQNSR